MTPDREWLRTRLTFLAVGPAEARLLDALLARVDRVERDEQQGVSVWFTHADPSDAVDDPWVIDPPGPIDPDAPASVRALLAHTRQMHLGEVGTSGQICLHDGFDGTWGCVGTDTGFDPEEAGWPEPVCAPIDLGLGSFYVVHPTTDEVRLYDHDGGLEKLEGKPSLAAVYLDLVLQRLRE